MVTPKGGGTVGVALGGSGVAVGVGGTGDQVLVGGSGVAVAVAGMGDQVLVGGSRVAVGGTGEGVRVGAGVVVLVGDGASVQVALGAGGLAVLEGTAGAAVGPGGSGVAPAAGVWVGVAVGRMAVAAAAPPPPTVAVGWASSVARAATVPNASGVGETPPGSGSGGEVGSGGRVALVASAIRAIAVGLGGDALGEAGARPVTDERRRKKSFVADGSRGRPVMSGTATTPATIESTRTSSVTSRLRATCHPPFGPARPLFTGAGTAARR